jgi:antitoxin component of RelBE/YafQ-DinJ toxin-antitoxin module
MKQLRTNVLVVRVTDKDRQAFLAHAAGLGLSLSSWIRMVLYNELPKTERQRRKNRVRAVLS